MKRLLLPLLLVMASLLIAAILTTVTAVTLASYSPDVNTVNGVVGQGLHSHSQALVKR